MLTSQKCSVPNASTSCNTKKNPPTFLIFHCLQPFQIFHLSEKKLKHEIKDKKNSPKTIHYRENSLSKFFCRATSIIIFLSNTTQKGKKWIQYKHNIFVTSRRKTIRVMIIQHPQAMSLHQNRFHQHPGTAENRKEIVPAWHWTVVLRTFCRQTLSLPQFVSFETSATSLLFFPPPFQSLGNPKYFYSKEIEW